MTYTKEQLKEKAVAFIESSKANDGRCMMLLMMLPIATGVVQHECVRRIYEMAEYEVAEDKKD